MARGRSAASRQPAGGGADIVDRGLATALATRRAPSFTAIFSRPAPPSWSSPVRCSPPLPTCSPPTRSTAHSATRAARRSCCRTSAPSISRRAISSARYAITSRPTRPIRRDPALALAAHNNRGNAFKEMRPLQRGRGRVHPALEAARAIESDLLKARILTNLASAQPSQAISTKPTRPPGRACASRRAPRSAGSRTCGASGRRSRSHAAISRPRAASSSGPSPASISKNRRCRIAISTTPPAKVYFRPGDAGRRSATSPPSSVSTTRPQRRRLDELRSDGRALRRREPGIAHRPAEGRPDPARRRSRRLAAEPERLTMIGALGAAHRARASSRSASSPSAPSSAAATASPRPTSS